MMRGPINVRLNIGYLLKVKWSRYRPGLAQRVCKGIALLFHDHNTRRGWVVISTRRPHFTPGKDPVPILQEAGWTPGPVWTGGNLVHTGIQSRSIQPVVSRYTTELPGPRATDYFPTIIMFARTLLNVASRLLFLSCYILHITYYTPTFCPSLSNLSYDAPP